MPCKRGSQPGVRRRLGRTVPSTPRAVPVLREYQMNRTENTREMTATAMSQTKRGVWRARWSVQRHFSCASAEKPYGIADMDRHQHRGGQDGRVGRAQVVEDHGYRCDRGGADDPECGHPGLRVALELIGEQAVVGGAPMAPCPREPRGPRTCPSRTRPGPGWLARDRCACPGPGGNIPARCQ